MIHDVIERREPTVVKEASLLVTPQAGQGRCPIAMRRRAVCLEAVDADLGGGMDRVPRLRVERWHVAGRTLRLAEEEGLAPSGRGGIERTFRRFRRGDRELVVVEGVELVRGVGWIDAPRVPRSAKKVTRVPCIWVAATYAFQYGTDPDPVQCAGLRRPDQRLAAAACLPDRRQGGMPCRPCRATHRIDPVPNY